MGRPLAVLFALLIALLLAACSADSIASFNLPISLREIQAASVGDYLIFSGFATPTKPLDTPVYYILRYHTLTYIWTNATLSTISPSIYGRTMIPFGAQLLFVTSGAAKFDVFTVADASWSQIVLPTPLADCYGPSSRPIGASLDAMLFWVHCGNEFLGYRASEGRWMIRASEAARDYVSAASFDGRLVFASVLSGGGEQGPFYVDHYDELDDSWTSFPAPLP